MPDKKLRKPSKQITATLGANLRALRLARRISQEELADICDLHRTYIGAIERGERNVTLSTLEVLAKATEVSVPLLLTPAKYDEEAETQRSEAAENSQFTQGDSKQNL